MTARAATVLQEALSLNDEERAEVVGALLDSLDTQFGAGVEAAWRLEVADRVATFMAEPVAGVPWEEIRNRFRARLGGASPR